MNFLAVLLLGFKNKLLVEPLSVITPFSSTATLLQQYLTTSSSWVINNIVKLSFLHQYQEVILVSGMHPVLQFLNVLGFQQYR